MKITLDASVLMFDADRLAKQTRKKVRIETANYALDFP